MNRNWIFISLYIFLIAAATVLVSTFGEAKKIVSFIESNYVLYQEDKLALISSNVIVYKNDGTESYIVKEQLYKEEFKNTNASLDIDIFSLVEFNKNDANNSVAILVSNLNLEGFFPTKDDQEYIILKAEIEFNQTISVNGVQTVKFYDSFTTMYDDSSKLILFNFDQLEAINPIKIKSIKITIDEEFNSVTQSKLLVNLQNSELVETTPTDIFEESLNRDIKALNEENFKSFEKYGLGNISSNQALYYNQDLIANFNSFNYYRYLYIIYEFLVIIPITYFIFFHGTVLSILRDKKKAKLKEYNELVNKMKNNKGE